MSYVKKNLLAEEKILYRAKIHQVIFVSPATWTIIALITFMYGPTLPAGQWFDFLPSPTLLLAGTLTLGAGLFWSLAIIKYYTSEYAVTNQRVLMKIGFIQIQSLELFLERIEGIQIDQSVIGRLLHYGTVYVIGIGGTADPFKFVRNPLDFRRQVQIQIEQHRQ